MPNGRGWGSDDPTVSLCVSPRAGPRFLDSPEQSKANFYFENDRMGATVFTDIL